MVKKYEVTFYCSSWKGKVVRKEDIITAKNYLTHDEIDSLNRLVTIFLETAELRVKDKKDIPLNFWKQNIDKMLAFNDRPVLNGKGSISNLQMEKKVKDIYTQFDQDRKIQEAKEADRVDLEEIESLIKKNKK